MTLAGWLGAGRRLAEVDYNVRDSGYKNPASA